MESLARHCTSSAKIFSGPAPSRCVGRYTLCCAFLMKKEPGGWSRTRPGTSHRHLPWRLRVVGSRPLSSCRRRPAEVKKEAVRAYGGEVIECKATLASREAVARRVEEQHGATFIHPSNDINVILGQGTAGLELLEDHPDLDYLFVPVGGGGLIAGCALAAHWWGSDCQTIGGEPFAVDNAFRSLVSGRIETNAKEAATIADGLKTQLGDRTFPIIQQHVTRVIRVDEEANRGGYAVDLGANEDCRRAVGSRCFGGGDA